MLEFIMLRASIVFAVSLLLASCSTTESILSAKDTSLPTDASTSTAYKFDGVDAPATAVSDSEYSQQEEYPQKTIDMIFPPEPEKIIELGSERSPVDKSMNIAGYSVHTKGNMPLRLDKNGRTLLNIRTANHWDTYHTFFVAESKLLGNGSKQLYIVATGPGGPCCTNYWIVDINGKVPRVIFRSEEFGRFRDPMEIFDADGDGIYELAQYDSSFRYFAGDCGTCSPEPKAYFRYDSKKRRYMPAKGIVEDFVLAEMRSTEKWLAEKKAELGTSKETESAFSISRSALSLTADLLFIGEENRAWKIFDTYVFDPKGELRKEMKWDLRQSKFYQELRKIPSRRARKR
ncbi:MAG TPA: hypothetical protein PLR83_08725 [Pyrinomonadaceae bacterium]|nr:hypothetical protein [Pyrinomonadaceae bacterium]